MRVEGEVSEGSGFRVQGSGFDDLSLLDVLTDDLSPGHADPTGLLSFE